MNYVITSGKTVDVAVEDALSQLGVSRNEVEVEIIEEASKGLFGLIGAKEATVKVSIIEDPLDIVKEIFNKVEDKKETTKVEPTESVKEKPVEIKMENKPVEAPIENENKDDIDIEVKASEFLGVILDEMGLEYSLEISLNGDILSVVVLSEEPEKLGIVIGKRGVTLDALQYLLSVIVNKETEEYVKVILDSNDYRKKREQSLVALAEKMAKKAKKYRNRVKLEPMNPYERRIIHSTVSGMKDVKTYSEGKDPYRRVVIVYDREKK
ncbi:MAG: KH domain-containing protein [Tissierellia bacterium]|nr:KH domain-containing protein [Tissierellia bacterium]